MGRTGFAAGFCGVRKRTLVLGLVHSRSAYRPDTGGTAVLAYRQGPLMKTLLRLFGKFTRWYITLIIFMACLLFIITTLGNMAGI